MPLTVQINIPGLLKPRGKRLTRQQRLHLAMVLSRQGVLKPCPENVAEAAKSEYERLALRVMETLKPGSISSLPDNAHTRFLVRVFYPAQLSRIFLEAFARPEPKRVYCLLSSALRLIAFERLFLEMLAAGALKKRQEERSLIARQYLLKLKPRAEDFADPSLESEHWLERFQAWYDAALNSLLLYLSRYCVEIASPDPLRSNAALLGYMFNRSGLPDLVREWAAEFFKRSDPALVQIFIRNLQEPRPFEGEWNNAEFRTWLVEIAPIVQGYEWSFPMLRRAAERRFPHLEHKLRSTEHLEYVWKKQLHLKLAPGVSARARRPTDDSNRRPPPMEAVAQAIESIGERRGQAWLFGQFRPLR